MLEIDVRGFRRLLREFEQLTQSQAVACCFGVSVAQCHALLETEHLGEATIGQLADKLELDKSTLSRTVDSLVDAGLVKRTPNPVDRRYVLVSLTRRGQSVCREIHSANDAFYEQVIESMPREYRGTLTATFEQFVTAMRSVADSEDDPGEAD